MHRLIHLVKASCTATPHRHASILARILSRCLDPAAERPLPFLTAHAPELPRSLPPEPLLPVTCSPARLQPPMQQSTPSCRPARQPLDKPSTRITTDDSYAFPVGRALRYIAYGEHYYRRHDGLADIHALLDHCAERVSGDGIAPVQERYYEWLGGGADDEGRLRGVVEEVAEARPLQEVVRFTNYHCHHVRTAFKRHRAGWTAHRPREGVGDCAASRGRPTPTGRSPEDLQKVVDYAFQASVLLHLTALYGVSDKYVESLLDICLSCTIYLSQSLNEHRHELGKDKPSLRHGCGGRPRKVDPFLKLRWSSLRWAAVHYSEGVRLWGLLTHPYPLWPMAKPRDAFGRVLQAHVGILTALHATHGSRLTRVTWGLFMAIKSGSAAQARTHAVARWFGKIDGMEGEQQVETFLHRYEQQRRLQLLPMLWLSAYCLHNTIPQVSSDHQSNDDDPLLSWEAARVTLVRLAPLFSHDAAVEPTYMALAQFLYGMPSHIPSHTEMALFISQMERCHAWPSTWHVNEDGGDELTTGACQDLLHRWWNHRHRRVGEPPRHSLALRSAHDLYAALASIPRCLMSPPSTAAATSVRHRSQPCGSPSNAMGSINKSAFMDGALFVTELVYRLLLQWRVGERLPTTVPDSTDAVTTRRAISFFVEELVLILVAGQHLRVLHARTVQTGERDGAVRDALETAMRALAEQLGRIVLPRRMRLLYEGGVPLLPLEERVMDALHGVLTEVLLGERKHWQQEAGCNWRVVGQLPRSYQDSMQAFESCARQW